MVQRSSQSLAPTTSVARLHRNNISSQQWGWYVVTKYTWGRKNPQKQILSIIPCRLTDSNRWPSDYKSDALPTELNRLSNSNNKLKQNHKSFKRLFYFGLARSNMSLLHWWLQRQDSNLRPQGYEPCELPTATTLLQFTSKATRMKACDIAFDIGKTGFEPATPCSQSKCATKLRYFPLIKY